MSPCLQPSLPDAGIAFNDKVVPRIDITIDPDSLMMLLDDSNLSEDHEYPANFYWNDGTNKDTIQNVGFRIRGNTSRVSQKKSFKIKFNHFGSKKFYGLSDFNLNGEHNDPSIIRSKLNWDILKLAGIESCRSNHVALYINKEYKGLYINVEHINEDYLRARHKNPDGQLFKCFYGADFVFRGTNTNVYSKSVYHAENNVADPDYYTLMEFIKALNDTENPDYRCELEKKFDVDGYLKTMAMEVLIGHWDNPIFNKNNAYLYFNPQKNKYELITFDIDNTYGIDWFNVDWSSRNIYSWAHPTDLRPIFNNLLKVPEYKIRYGYYINKYIKIF
ncbi:MAG: CotH kinase family protein [Saprospiraceae bacterium]|nr:CotH kinase family protein [Saprospiraceae bacterium]